jgi:hypothetical protein
MLLKILSNVSNNKLFSKLFDLCKILFITSNRSVPELYVAGQSYIFYPLRLSVSLICLVAYRYTPQIGV